MKTLQLQGLETYNGPKTKHHVVSKGQIITVNDADAEYMTREGTHEVVNSLRIDHWKVLPNGTRADFHFATEEASAEELADFAEAAAKAAVEEDEKPAKAARGGQRASRTPRARAQ